MDRNPKSVTVPDGFNASVSKALRKAAFAARVDARAISGDTGIAYGTVVSYLNGDRVPSLWRFKVLCEYLEVDPNVVLGLE